MQSEKVVSRCLDPAPRKKTLGDIVQVPCLENNRSYVTHLSAYVETPE